ncbi:MAG: resolvase protein, partial [uncultured bacterium]
MAYIDEEIDITKVRYALYIRKSTDDPQRQHTSIPDQLAECGALIDHLGLHIVGDPIIESRSAKTPNNRPKFSKLLKDIEKGIYDGIIAWNPDRLARNMMEGGEIINMIDTESLKDLKFVTHHFSRDANGKMLLGMAFVLSKQYSDKLSQDVTRGVRGRLREGKGSGFKHGYRRGAQDLQVPDGRKFELICEAWQMRVRGESLESISKYLNDEGYSREYKKNKQIVRMTTQTLSLLFQDSFYYGMLIQTNQKIYLPDLYDFEPAVTEEEFITVQEMSRAKPKAYKSTRKTFYPLKMLITCKYCGNHMYAGASKSSNGDRFLYYRCDTKQCPRIKKSIRAKVIFDFIIEFLENNLNLTKSDYMKLQEQFGTLSEVTKQRLQQEIHNKEAVLRHSKSEEEHLTLSYASQKINKIGKSKKIIENRIKELNTTNETLESEISQIKEKMALSEQEILTYQQFLNLSKNATTAIKNGDPMIQDKICQYIFLNLVTDDEKVLSYQLKDPFSTLLKGSLSNKVGVPRLELGTS